MYVYVIDKSLLKSNDYIDWKTLDKKSYVADAKYSHEYWILKNLTSEIIKYQRLKLLGIKNNKHVKLYSKKDTTKTVIMSVNNWNYKVIEEFKWDIIG